MTHTVTVYRSGNSKVITIPASLNIQEGDQFSLTKNQNRLVLKKLAQKEKALQQIDQLAGSLPGLAKDLDDIGKLEEFLQGAYE